MIGREICVNGSDDLTRRISMDNDFMNYQTDDIIYIYMRCLSTVRVKKENEWLEYLSKKKFIAQKNFLSKLLNCTTKTIENKVKKLISLGLVEEKLESFWDVNGNETKHTIYIFPYDEDGSFKWVDKKLLEYLVYTRNNQGVRIFLYLYNKFAWKGSEYIFTAEEIKKALGYSETTKSADGLIKATLESLRAEGMIAFEEITQYSEVNGRMVPVKRKKLNNVVKELSEEKLATLEEKK